MNKHYTVLIITSRRSNHSGNSWEERKQAVKKFNSTLEGMLKDTRVLFTTYTDLIFYISNNKISVFDKRNNIDIAQVNFVHFKNWQYDQATAPVVAKYLQQKKVLFSNSEVLRTAAVGKLAQMLLLATSNIPVPATLSASTEEFKKIALSGLPDPFRYPFIFKADNGAKGENNFLIRSPDEFSEILNKIEKHQEYILQEYIPNDGDYRYLFFGLEDQPLVFLRRGGAGSHLNNTSQGGSGEFQEIEGVVAQYVPIAKQAASITKKEIAGVDILVDKNTKKAYVLEINGTPAIATGFGKNEKLNTYAQHIQKQMESQERL